MIGQLNPTQLSARLAAMSDQQLQQYAMLHHDDPFVMSVAIDVKNQRDALRASRAAQPQPQQPPVVQQLIAQMAQLPPMQGGQGQQMPAQKLAQPPQQGQPGPQQAADGGLMRGIARLPARNIARMADGGIAGYADGGVQMSPGMLDFAQRSKPVLRMAGGTNALQQYADLIRTEATQQGIDPDVAMRLFMAESGGDPEAVSPKGAVGFGQLKEAAAKEMGLSPEDRKDPVKNIRASIGYLAKQQQAYGGDMQKALAAYNWGPGNLNKHLQKNEGMLNNVGLPKETVNYINKILPIGTAQAAPATPPVSAGQIPGAAPGAVAPPAQPQEEGFFSRLGTRLGLSEETKRNLANLNMATAGAMGPVAATTALPRVATSGGLGALGERIYGALSPTARKAQEAQAALKEAQAVRAAQAPIEAAEAAQMSGALPGEAEAAAQGVRAAQAAQAAQVPSAAQKVQAASTAREAADVARVAQAARMAQAGTQAGAVSTLASPAAAAVAAKINPPQPSPGQRPESDIERNKFLEANLEPGDIASAAKAVDVAKQVLPPERRKGWDWEDLMAFGLSMMAGQSPYAAQNIGKAGLAAIANKQAREKEEREDIYRAALSRQAEAAATKYSAEAGFYTEGTKGATVALANARQLLAAWEKDNAKMALLNPEKYAADRDVEWKKALKDSFTALGLKLPAELSSDTSATKASFVFNPQTGKLEPNR